MKKVWISALLAVLIWACSSDSSEDPVQKGEEEQPAPVSFERKSMLVNWADNIIIPSYESFSFSLSALQTNFEAFRQEPTASNLINLRAAWLSSYKSWQQVSMFEIGPAESVGLRLQMNIYPTDAEKIESFIAGGTYDLSLSSNRDAKGFPALDYLINGLGENDEAIVSKFSTTDKDAILAYMGDVLLNMNDLTEQVLTEWKSGYRDTFVNNDGASATASVDRFVNDYIFYYEKFLRAGKMGFPLGVFTGNVLPENVEAYFKADVSNELFLAGLNAFQDFFNGKHFGKNSEGESLTSYLDNLNELKDGEDLSVLINNQINTAREKVGALTPFRAEIENNNPPTAMYSAYDEVQRVVPLLKVDMVSAMSISIDFVDADGD